MKVMQIHRSLAMAPYAFYGVSEDLMSKYGDFLGNAKQGAGVFRMGLETSEEVPWSLKTLGAEGSPTSLDLNHLLAEGRKAILDF